MKLSYKGGGIALFQKDTKSDEYTILLGKRKHHPGKGNLVFEMKPSYRLTKTVFHEFSEVKQIPLSELKKYKLAFGIKTEVKAFKKLYK